jgi:hypothetical protein
MDILGSHNQIYFPAQKVPTKTKNEDWMKRCVDAGESMLYYRNGMNREKMLEIERNYNIYNGLAIPEDMEKVFNPMDIEGITFPSECKSYPISSPKIDLITGEEYLRKDNWVIRSINESAVSSKQDQQYQMIMELVQQELQNKSYSEEEASVKIQKLGKYMKYSWKDAAELAASRLLHYIYKEQNLKKKFNEGMTDLLVSSREIYRVDEVAGDVVVEKVDPRTIYMMGLTKDFKVEDSDIIIQIQYLPIGKVIDEFHEFLKDEDISYLEGGISDKQGNSVLNYAYVNPRMYYPLSMSEQDPRLIEVDQGFTNYGFVGPFDSKGNVRVVRIRWRGRRKIGKLTYFDEFGDKAEKWVSEFYKPDSSAGETVKWMWVNEAYEGTKLGGHIYVKMQLRKFQIRGINNKSRCDLGYIGTDCGVSMMSRMAPFQFAYNIYMRRLELLVARFGGPIIELDMSKIPDDWDLDKWMYYLHILGYMIVDPWNEGKKGAAQGKLAGMNNTTNKAISPEIGQFIQQNISMLAYIEQQLGTIAGITKQREGQIDNRETVGGVERAITQSSHTTEKWFTIHEDTKRRVLQACVDVAKQVYRGKNLKADFILDDTSRVLLDINGDDIANADLDVFVNTSSEDSRIRQTFESLAQSFVQNGSSASVLLNVMKSESIAEMSHLLEEDEEMRAQQAQQAEQAKMQSAERINAMALEDKEKDREIKRYEIDMNYTIELLKLQNTGGNEDLVLKMKEHESKVALKKEEIEEKKRHNIASEEETTRNNKEKVRNQKTAK